MYPPWDTLRILRFEKALLKTEHVHFCFSKRGTDEHQSGYSVSIVRSGRGVEILSDPVKNDLVLLLGAKNAYRGARDLIELKEALHPLYLVGTETAITTTTSCLMQVS